MSTVPRRTAAVRTDDGALLHAVVDGREDAPVTLVLAHGWTLAQAAWDDVAALLAPRVVDGGLRLVRYRPLFSGPAVERVPELQFQRPEAEVELAAADAEARGIAPGDTVTVRSNGTSIELRAHVNRRLRPGTARIAEEHAVGLHTTLEVAAR